MTEFFSDIVSVHFLTALVTIIFIDLILAGDNAIVIGLAARNLPAHQQKQAVIWGTAGAIAIRAVATLLVVYILDVPWLHLGGGLLLIWIAYKLLVEDNGHGDIKAGNTLWASIRTIVIADAAMGIDNVIAVAGAAKGAGSGHDTFLIILGLIITVPIIVWGSTLFIKLINRYTWIVYAGSAVLAYTAAKMITHEKKLANFFLQSSVIDWTFIIIVTVVTVAVGYLVNKRKK